MSHTETSYSDDSFAFVDPQDDHIAAIKQLQDLVIELQQQNEKLSEQLYVLDHFQRDYQSSRSNDDNKPRFYAVLRGHFVDSTNTFMRGVYNNCIEADRATRGAWRASQKSFRTVEEAEDYFQKHLPEIEVEDASFFNPSGVFSTKWYAVWTVDPTWHAIVPTCEEADHLFAHRHECQRKAFSSYQAAKEHLQSLFP